MPNEDPKSGGSHQVKLFFDVMSEAAGHVPTAEIHQIKTTSVFPPPPPPPAAPPKFARPAAPAPSNSNVPVSDDGPQPSRSGFKLRAPKFNFKLLAIIGIIALLVAGSYFAYRYFVKRGEDDKTADLQARSQKPPQQPLPAEWLKKYFGSETCDLAVCGPDADPDQDGLKNTKELQYNTSPLNADSDFDGLADSDEVQVYNSDPLVSDTDGDGFEDGVEVRNGYSPTTASQSPMSNMEKTVFSDNVSSFGLHEPTKTFLSLTSYKTAFKDASAGQALPDQLSLSVPDDLRAAEISSLLTFGDQVEPSIIIASINTQPSGPASALSDSIKTVINKAGESKIIRSDSGAQFGSDYAFFEYTYKTPDQIAQHGMTKVFRKDGVEAAIILTKPESKWNDFAIKAQTVVNSFRLIAAKK